MRYVEAPERYLPAPGDPPVVFLAGGITGCPDWQADAVAALAGRDVVLLNPRRAAFGVPDGGAVKPSGVLSGNTDARLGPEQVRWEHHHLHLPGVRTLFWFPACDPARTVQPISLLELGAALDNPARHIVVGADPGYPRRLDVELQAACARPEIVVHTTLDDVLAELTRTLT